MTAVQTSHAALPSSSPAAKIRHYLNPIKFSINIWSNRELILQLTKREIEGRYKGSYLGLLWSLITPMLMLGIYTFVFGVVFKGRWPHSRSDSLVEFSLLLFAGITAFTIFSECLSRAPNLIVGVPAYVKKVVFPLEILPVTILGAALFHAMMSLCMLVTVAIFFGVGVPWTIVFVPFALIPLATITLGFSWFFASLGVYLRDLGYAVAVGVQILYFATPVFYPLDSVPSSMRPLMLLNPMAVCVEHFRGLAMQGILPAWKLLAASWVLGLVVMALGYTWFMITRKGFADVI